MAIKHVDVSIQISGDGVSLSFVKQNAALTIDETPPPTITGFLLMESGAILLTETNDKFELEAY